MDTGSGRKYNKHTQNGPKTAAKIRTRAPRRRRDAGGSAAAGPGTLNPRPRALKVSAAPALCPVSMETRKIIPDQTDENRPPGGGPGHIWPALCPKRGPNRRGIFPDHRKRWRRKHDPYKGNPGALYRVLRRQQERGAALPCGRVPFTPLPNGPQAEAGRSRPGRG